MSSSTAQPVRAALLLLLLAAGLLAMLAPVANAAEAGALDPCPVAECVIDDGLDNQAAPGDPVEGGAGEAAAVEPQEMVDDAEDIGVGGADPAVAAADPQPVVLDSEPATVEANSVAVAGAEAVPSGRANAANAATGDGGGAVIAAPAAAPTGELPFTGTSEALMAAIVMLGLLSLVIGAALHGSASRRRPVRASA